MTHTRAIPLWSLAVLACLHLGGAHAQMPFPSAALTAEDQAIADSFAQPQSAANPFDTAGQPGSFGLAPQFNASAGGTLKRLSYGGRGTVGYDEQPIASGGAVNLACGLGYIDAPFQAAYVGIGNSYYNKGFSCGRCIRVQCDDVTCANPGAQEVALIVDNCGECYDADATLAMPLFTRLAGRPANPNPSLTISWEFVDCSPYINTTIKMLVKPGGTAYYQAFNFANSRQVITAVQVNGQRLKHETSNYWSWNPQGGPIDPRGPFDFALLGANRQVIRVRVAQLRPQDLKTQFAAPTAGVPGTEPSAPEVPASVVPAPGG